MDVKIDYAKLIDWYSGVQTQMNNLMMHVSALVAMEQEIVNGNAIHGSAADGIVTYIKDVHWGQIVPCITERQQELSTLITEYMAGLEQKDMSIDAIVESSYLQELETSLDEHRDQAIDILDAIRTCTNSIRHIIELNPRSTENMKCAYEALRKEASRTREDYEEYEEQAYDAINKYQEVMRNAAYQISNETHNMPDLRSYKAGTHVVDLLSSVREKAEAYPYSNLFDADRYAENVACMQEVELIRMYDKLGDKKEGGEFNVGDGILNIAFNIAEKTTTGIVGTVGDIVIGGITYSHYSKFDKIAEKWKENPELVQLDSVSDPVTGIITYNDARMVQDFMGLGQELSGEVNLNATHVTSVYNIVDTFLNHEETDNAIVDNVAGSMQYYNYVLKLYSN